MPLLKGKKNIGHNIKVEKEAGKKQDQAVAIALNVARTKKRGNKMHKKSEMSCKGMKEPKGMKKDHYSEKEMHKKKKEAKKGKKK